MAKRGENETLRVDYEPKTVTRTPERRAETSQPGHDSRDADRAASNDTRHTQVDRKQLSLDGPINVVKRPAQAPVGKPPVPPTSNNGLSFDGRTRVTIAESSGFDMTNRDYTVFARIKTRRGGTISFRKLRAGCLGTRRKNPVHWQGEAGLRHRVGWLRRVTAPDR